MLSPTPPQAVLNELLAALPVQEFSRLSPHLTLTHLRARQVLYKRDEPLKYVFFPGRALCSLIVTLQDGASAEIAVVGPEGVVGIEAVLGVRIAACDATVQVPGDGHAFVMPVEAFREGLAALPQFRDVVSGYSQAFVRFLMRSVACNARHSVEERCCRWLLHAHDRLATDELMMTHDLLSSMLGVRRPTVTLVISDLARAGTVFASRGRIRIVDRPALENRACSCYREVAEAYEKHMPRGHTLVSGGSAV